MGLKQTASMVRFMKFMNISTCLRQRMKAVRLSNRPPNLDNAKLKMTALENLRFQGLDLNGDAPSGNEWFKLKDVVAEASQTRM